jgi:hypothetical protein
MSVGSLQIQKNCLRIFCEFHATSGTLESCKINAFKWRNSLQAGYTLCFFINHPLLVPVEKSPSLTLRVTGIPVQFRKQLFSLLLRDSSHMVVSHWRGYRRAGLFMCADLFTGPSQLSILYMTLVMWYVEIKSRENGQNYITRSKIACRFKLILIPLWN